MAKDKQTAKDYFPEAKDGWQKLLANSVTLPTTDIADTVWSSWKLDDESEKSVDPQTPTPDEVPAADSSPKPKTSAALPNAVVELYDVENIRALVQPGSPITFASYITLFFGRNSSGKSTISQALRVFAEPAIKQAPPGFADEDNAKDRYDTVRKSKVKVCSLNDYHSHTNALGLTTQDCEWCSDHSNEIRLSLELIDHKLVERKEAQEPWNSDFALGLDAFDRVRDALDLLSAKLDQRKIRLKHNCQSLLGSNSEESYNSAYTLIEALGTAVGDDKKLETREAGLQSKLLAARDARKNEKQLRDEVTTLTKKLNAVQLLRSPDGSRAAVLTLLRELTQLRKTQEGTLADIIRRHGLEMTHQLEWERFAESGEVFLEMEFDSSKYPQEGDKCIYCGQGLEDMAFAFIKDVREHLGNTAKRRLKEVSSNADEIKQALLELQGYDSIPIVEEDEEVSSGLLVYEDDSLLKIEQELTAKSNEKQQLVDTVTSGDKLEGLVTSIEGELAEVKSLLFAIRNRVPIETWKGSKDALLRNGELSSEVATQKKVWSNQRTSAANSLAIETFRDNFNKECTNLGLKVQVTVRHGTDNGLAVRRTVVRGRDPGNILSESERAVWVVADCLAELKTVKRKCVLVLDDPVSSMDTERANLLARRIVAESEERQVIVLTHNRHFYLALRGLIKSEYKGCRNRARGYFVERWREQTGLVREIDLFEMRDKSLRDKIQSIIDKGTSDHLEIATGFLVLRGLIEDFVDHDLLRGFRTRLDPEMVRIQWKELKAIDIEGAVVETLERLYHRISDLGGLHLTGTYSLRQPTRQDLEDVYKELVELLDKAKTGTGGASGEPATS